MHFAPTSQHESIPGRQSSRWALPRGLRPQRPHQFATRAAQNVTAPHDRNQIGQPWRRLLQLVVAQPGSVTALRDRRIADRRNHKKD